MSDNERPSIRKMIEDKTSKKGTTNAVESTMPKLFLACAVVSILTTFGIVFTLLFETVTFFSEVSIVEFVTSSEWYPMFSDPDYGIRPLLLGTFTVAVIAMIIAIPVGLAVAIYLSEYASDKVRRTIKPILEVLAGIPTIVYGFFALTFVTPVLQAVIPGLAIYNALSPGLVMGIMIVPMVASLSEDAMSAVPQSMREGAFALGATRLEVSLKVVFPAALSGIIASFVLAISRAIGETMIVSVAGGGSPANGFDITSSMQTMTSYIVQMSLGDAGFGTTVYYSIYAVGMTLFIFTLAMNILAQFISKRFREEY